MSKYEIELRRGKVVAINTEPLEEQLPEAQSADIELIRDKPKAESKKCADAMCCRNGLERSLHAARNKKGRVPSCGWFRHDYMRWYQGYVNGKTCVTCGHERAYVDS